MKTMYKETLFTVETSVIQTRTASFANVYSVMSYRSFSSGNSVQICEIPKLL